MKFSSTIIHQFVSFKVQPGTCHCLKNPFAQPNVSYLHHVFFSLDCARGTSTSTSVAATIITMAIFSLFKEGQNEKQPGSPPSPRQEAAGEGCTNEEGNVVEAVAVEA